MKRRKTKVGGKIEEKRRMDTQRKKSIKKTGFIS
jgi:hypothetical protein